MLDPEYAKFIDTAQARQLAYIEGERARMTKAEALFQTYRMAMYELGLHPLTITEIVDRNRELQAMEKAIPKTHGDGPTMRWSFERSAMEQVT